MGRLATATKQNMAGLLWLAVLCSTAFAQLDILEQKTCGENQCEKYQYCSIIDFSCKDCSKICDSKDHNFERKICVDDCQDFLHDQQYEKKGGNYDQLIAKVQRLEIIANVSLVLSIILALIVIYLITIWIKRKTPLFLLQFKKKKKPEKSYYPGDAPISTIRLPTDTTVTVPSAITDAVRTPHPKQPSQYKNLTTFKNPAPKRTDPEAPSPTSTTTTTTNFSRAPFEKRVPSQDSTMDFSYDNPAMTPSPVAGRVS